MNRLMNEPTIDPNTYHDIALLPRVLCEHICSKCGRRGACTKLEGNGNLCFGCKPKEAYE